MASATRDLAAGDPRTVLGARLATTNHSSAAQGGQLPASNQLPQRLVFAPVLFPLSGHARANQSKEGDAQLEVSAVLQRISSVATLCDHGQCLS